MLCLVDDTGDGRPDGAEERKDNQVVKDEEEVQLCEDMAFATRLSLVAGSNEQAAENDGQNQVEEGHQSRRPNTLDDTPSSRMSCQIIPESRPNTTQVAQVDQEDGNHGVGGDPEEGEQQNPEVVHRALPASGLRSQRDVIPDNIVRSRSQANCHAMGLLLAEGVGDAVSFSNVRIASKSVRHGTPLIHTRPDIADMQLEVPDAFRQVFDGVNLLPRGVSAIGGILLGGVAQRSRSRKLLRILHVFCEDLLQLADRPLVFGDKLGEILDVSRDCRASE